MRLALDTNVLAYAEGTNGAAMQKTAIEFIQKLSPDETFIPVQALGELFGLLVRKARRSADQARTAIVSWGDAFPLIETSVPVIFSAADLVKGHHLSIWDAVILSASAEAGCRLLLSEDMHEGFTWRGVTIANPFAETKHPLLAALLTSKQ